MTSAREIAFEDLSPGVSADISWTAEVAEIESFAELSGDRNPLHMDGAYAREQGFADRVVHGFLLGAKVSALIGMFLPGRRCLLVEESLSFPNPVYPGDEVTLSGEVVNTRADLALVSLKIKGEKKSESGTQSVVRGKVLCKILS
uniref:Putative MaoC like domain protein n=1 Tax=uncultured marine microorganism HF4000_APKG8K5 TaxID=455555 RepID=B3TB45_9ZZZZ|nr:putative MaoC like domain protein [uncultured marine microorganism HF4000_APKG8K5]